jgi:hypothetical protein
VTFRATKHTFLDRDERPSALKNPADADLVLNITLPLDTNFMLDAQCLQVLRDICGLGII